eukprot:sb/3473526/
MAICKWKPVKLRPTLKEIAEEYIRQQREQEEIRQSHLRQAERDAIVRQALRKDASFVTTDGDEDSLDLRASSYCSMNNSRLLPTSLSLSTQIPSSPVVTDQVEDKDSGYGAELRSKRKLVRFPTNEEDSRNQPNQKIRVPDWLITSHVT